MLASCCELVLAWCWEAMDEDEFLGRAVASGEGARVWFMAAPAHCGEGKGKEIQGQGKEQRNRRWRAWYTLLHPGRASPCRTQRWWSK